MNDIETGQPRKQGGTNEQPLHDMVEVIEVEPRSDDDDDDDDDASDNSDEHDHSLSLLGNQSMDPGFDDDHSVSEKKSLINNDSKSQRPIIKLDNVHKTYLLGIEGVPALRGVNLSINQGEFVAIFGTSGGGKTTMLNIMGTIDKPTKGILTIGKTRIGNNTSDETLAEIRLHDLGFVFQTFNLLSSMTALENVEMPMILGGRLNADERRERARALLARVGMSAREDHLPSQLSGGEQQRVTIARAIANAPRVLLLDEPTGDLDTVNTSIVMNFLLELNKQENITMIMVTHDRGLKNFAERVVWMRDGKIARVEPVEQEKRAARIAELDEKMDEIYRERGDLRKGKEMMDSLNKEKPQKVFKNTVVRKATAYRPYKHFAQTHGIVQDIQENTNDSSTTTTTTTSSSSSSSSSSNRPSSSTSATSTSHLNLELDVNESEDVEGEPEYNGEDEQQRKQQQQQPKIRLGRFSNKRPIAKKTGKPLIVVKEKESEDNQQ